MNDQPETIFRSRTNSMAFAPQPTPPMTPFFKKSPAIPLGQGAFQRIAKMKVLESEAPLPEPAAEIENSEMKEPEAPRSRGSSMNSVAKSAKRRVSDDVDTDDSEVREQK